MDLSRMLAFPPFCVLVFLEKLPCPFEETHSIKRHHGDGRTKTLHRHSRAAHEGGRRGSDRPYEIQQSTHGSRAYCSHSCCDVKSDTRPLAGSMEFWPLPHAVLY